MADIIIDGRTIGEGRKAFVIAEVAQAHDGSLGMAHAYIDAAAQMGADAIKFQTHIAAAESTRDETFRVPMSGQDATRYDYWKRMEFTEEQWHGLRKHAVDKGLVFLSSCFSVAAVELMQKVGMSAWKVGSGEFRSTELLEAMMKTGAPVMLSTGMSRFGEIEAAAKLFGKHKTSFALFQCTSAYPAPLDKVGLNVIDEYRKKFKCPVGLSDHSGTVWPSLAAMARGADMIEVHVTFDKRMYGPDVASSLTFAEFEQVCKGRDAFHQMLSQPVDKEAVADKMETMRNLFTKSIAPSRALKAGTVLTDDMLAPKKPGTGLPYAERKKIIGMRLAVDVGPDRLLRLEDLENQEKKKHG